MFNDVTKTKLIEEKRIMEKSMLLGKISHEFKNPFIVICETIDELKENNEIIGKDLDFQNKKLQFLKNLSQYMIILIKDFEVVANIENRKQIDILISDIDPHEFFEEIEEIINTLIKKKNSKEALIFKLNISKNIEKISTDQLRLKQILINLLSNSIKFTDKGYIELKVEKIGRNLKENECIDFLLTEFSEITTKQFIKFSIIDSGKGLSKDFLNRFNNGSNSLLKENSQENVLGTGYGLEIVQKLCKSIGAKIHVVDNVPTGSNFYFYIYEEKLNEISNYELKELEESTTHGKKVSIDTYNDKELVNHPFKYQIIENISNEIKIDNKRKYKPEFFHSDNNKLVFIDLKSSKNLNSSRIDNLTKSKNMLDVELPDIVDGQDLDDNYEVLSNNVTILQNFPNTEIPNTFLSTNKNAFSPYLNKKDKENTIHKSNSISKFKKEDTKKDKLIDENKEGEFTLILQETNQIFSNGPIDEQYTSVTFVIVDDEYMKEIQSNEFY